MTWVRVELVGNDFVLSSQSATGLCERKNNTAYNGEYSPGAVLNVSNEMARCATVFDKSSSGKLWPVRGTIP